MLSIHAACTTQGNDRRASGGGIRGDDFGFLKLFSFAISFVVLILALLFPSQVHAGEEQKLSAAAVRARDIANRMQAALDPDQCRSRTSCRVTVAAAVLDNGKVIVAVSEDDREMRSPLKDIARQEDADIARGPGHAEKKIVEHVRTSLFFYRNRKILVIAAGRPICERCERLILDAGAKPASPCVSGRTY